MLKTLQSNQSSVHNLQVNKQAERELKIMLFWSQGIGIKIQAL